MKLFALLLLCAFACYVKAESKLTEEKVREISNQCKEETSTTDADIADMLQHQPASGTPAKCMRSCVMKKLDMVDADGKMLKAPLVDVIKYAANGDAAKEAVAEAIADACINIKLPTDACESAEENVLCMIKQFKDRGFKPRKH